MTFKDIQAFKVITVAAIR